MHTTKKLIRELLFFIVLIIATISATAQKTSDAKELAIKNIVDSQRYVFYAQYVNPNRGGRRALTSEYTVKVLKDTVTFDLPYFGRSYSAPMGTNDGGINFTTTDFEYKIETRKKGGWNISIKPKDVQGGHQFSMTIFENGTSSLQANSNSREPISFDGYIESIKPKKK